MLVALVVSIGPIGLPAPAAADTACADVAVEFSGQPDWYVAGPGNCTPTPFARALNLYGGVRQPGLPTGTPSGIRWDVWVTGPI
jgi:hypothetical protein